MFLLKKQSKSSMGKCLNMRGSLLRDGQFCNLQIEVINRNWSLANKQAELMENYIATSFWSITGIIMDANIVGTSTSIFTDFYNGFGMMQFYNMDVHKLLQCSLCTFFKICGLFVTEYFPS
jgi:hypothetical protein